MIVSDTNLISYLLIQGIHTPKAEAVYARDSVWMLPPLWRSEFLNVLTTSVSAGLLNEQKALAAWTRAVRVVSEREIEPDPTAVLRIAIRSRISAYDAQFVALAQMLAAPLVTADRDLAKRCPDHVMIIDHFLAG